MSNEVNEADPWLVCPETEFEQFANFLRLSPHSEIRQRMADDGVDIEDLIIALRVKREMIKNEGTRH